MSVLLVTSRDLPDGEPGAAALEAELRRSGVEARWAVWDDDTVDWSAAALVAVRSTWDYTERAPEFLRWARSLDQARLLNGADVFAWNHDKRYLLDLHDVPTVPTAWLTSAAQLVAAVDDLGTAVVKPAVGAGGEGLAVLAAGLAEEEAAPYVETGAVVVQPLVESVRSHGEVSVFVVDGAPVCQVEKLPAGEEVRVHEEYGGSSRVVPLEPACVDVALAADAEAGRRFGRRLDYLRADLLWWEGAWVVSELELIEPGLYLDVAPGNARPFADLVLRRSRSAGA
jgi:hypothetical protein